MVTTTLPSISAFDEWYSNLDRGSVHMASTNTSTKHHTFHMSDDGVIYFGDTQLTAKHIQLLDRLLHQEFPEEFI